MYIGGYWFDPSHQSGAEVESVIIKYSEDSPPKDFEGFLLTSLDDHPPTSTTTNVVKAPSLYFHDRETNTQNWEDFPCTDALKMMLFSTDAPYDAPSLFAIGRQLRVWLPSFHSWASAPEQAGLRELMWQNDHMRKTKYNFTYGTVIKVLKNFPRLLEGCETTLATSQLP